MGAVKKYGNINIGLSLNRKLGQSGSVPRQESPARFGGETRRNPSSWHFAGALGNLARRWVYRVRGTHATHLESARANAIIQYIHFRSKIGLGWYLPPTVFPWMRVWDYARNGSGGRGFCSGAHALLP